MSAPCPRCGTTVAELGAPGGRMGCAVCYDHFREELTAALARRVERVAHLGLQPTRESAAAAARRDLARLRALCDRAVAEEDFEAAARLRDQIADLQRQDPEAAS
ncbi:MAG TPA: UvrB/UvrC motif-containing protein [Candidatus Krumholzibacteria bacterium]|nr:UvrB/UvrC motif-containing protein [Candidatus Krumholzibacteria bacterium]HRX50462.1 UvrB/UvrC motif-containing protein [Candidatus Krumholzibacteria bacterium]